MSVVGLTHKALDASPALRALADRAFVQDVVQTQRAARVLTPAGRFAINQPRRGSAGRYRIKSSGALVHLRHRTRDVAILNEIFIAECYEPPAALDLAGPLRVVDLGGNVGLFGLFALGRWNVDQIRSFEPDPANARLLRATAGPYRQWQVLEAAVSTRTGSMDFVVGRYSESRAAANDETGVAVPVVDLFAEAGDVDLLKMDIEGGEWAILEDPRLPALGAKAVVMEWHREQCPAPDPPRHARASLRGGIRSPARQTWTHRLEWTPLGVAVTDRAVVEAGVLADVMTP